MISRRNFLKKTATTGAATFALGGFLARAYGRAEAIGPLAASALPETDRVLVLVQLDGGNDGLNTLVNYENDAYYTARPTLNIPKNRVLRINETLGFHPELKDLKNLYDEGLLTAIQGIGYPNPDRSHFRSTDIWLSASDSDEYLSTGWLGRYLETQFPEFPDKIPEHPLAVDIGPVVSLSLLGKNGALGIALRNPGTFFNLVDQGNKIIDKNKIPTPAGYELEFIRQVNFESLQYASQVKEAAKKGKNKVTYPGTGLGSRLSLVSRLIHGGLRSRVYLVSQRGYDTHANQLARHTALLRELNDAVAAFQNDMERLGLQDRVLGLTISEFGRRVKENGSAGTDHGTAAPLFVFGPAVKGGILGAGPNFNNLDNRGDFFHDYDFRQIYASILNQWFGVSRDIVRLVFPMDPAFLPLLHTVPYLETADFNRDGKVDFDDFVAFARGFGKSDPTFDLDGDGRVGFSDFVAFARAFGTRREP